MLKTEDVERWLSWSKAHDWKSCNVSKAFWGSNPHLSAKMPGTDGSGFLFYKSEAVKMSVTIAMPRMSTDPELTAAQAKYPESLARAGADVRWVELSDPERAVQEALTCDGLLLPGGGDMESWRYGPPILRAGAHPRLWRAEPPPRRRRAAAAASLSGC